MQCLAVPDTIVGLKLVTCPSLLACALNQKRKHCDKHWTTSLLNLLIRDIIIDVSNST